jgi:hypothetical protein
MHEWLLILGVAVAGLGLRTFDHPWLRKAGAVCFLVATYLGGLALTGNHGVAVVAVAGWFFLPWVEILMRIRHLRMPLDKPLKSGFPPSAERFPQLGEMTEEIEAEGFERVDDASFEWAGSRQFMRILHHQGERTQAVISLLEQGPMALAWVSVSSRLPDGRTWTTWNYPFSHTMMLAPETRLNPVLDAESFLGMLEAHRELLLADGLMVGDLALTEPEGFPELIQRETRRQIDHNLDQGVITLSGEGTFRYSFRGYLFLWRQFLRDMVRLS